MPKRTELHSLKIIESKRKNGTLKHSDNAKQKIRHKINKLYQSLDAPITMSENSGGKHKNGYINEYFYRSSYEKIFIEYCINNNINLESAENKKYRIRYLGKDNKFHYYYPDFYLIDYDVIIEIKPKSMLYFGNNEIKFKEASKKYKFMIISENELIDLDKFFKDLMLV